MMKLKSNQTRTYDQDGYKKRAACVCFRSGAEDEVLLVSSSRYPDRWIVPGGGLEPEEDPSAAAIREVCEELMWLGVSTHKALSFEMCPVLQKKGLNPIVSVFHMNYRDKDLTGGYSCHMCRKLVNPLRFRKAGVKGTLGRLLGVFENLERKHRTFVYVLTVTEVLDDWEDSLSIGRKRRWFSIEEAVHALQGHKPVQASYFQSLRQSCHPSNGSIPLSSHKPLPDVR